MPESLAASSALELFVVPASERRQYMKNLILASTIMVNFITSTFTLLMLVYQTPQLKQFAHISENSPLRSWLRLTFQPAVTFLNITYSI